MKLFTSTQFNGFKTKVNNLAAQWDNAFLFAIVQAHKTNTQPLNDLLRLKPCRLKDNSLSKAGTVKLNYLKGLELNFIRWDSTKLRFAFISEVTGILPFIVDEKNNLNLENFELFSDYESNLKAKATAAKALKDAAKVENENALKVARSEQGKAEQEAKEKKGKAQAIAAAKVHELEHLIANIQDKEYTKAVTANNIVTLCNSARVKGVTGNLESLQDALKSIAMLQSAILASIQSEQAKIDTVDSGRVAELSQLKPTNTSKAANKADNDALAALTTTTPTTTNVATA